MSGAIQLGQLERAERCVGLAHRLHLFLERSELSALKLELLEQERHWAIEASKLRRHLGTFGYSNSLHECLDERFDVRLAVCHQCRPVSEPSRTSIQEGMLRGSDKEEDRGRSSESSDGGAHLQLKAAMHRPPPARAVAMKRGLRGHVKEAKGLERVEPPQSRKLPDLARMLEHMLVANTEVEQLEEMETEKGSEKGSAGVRPVSYPELQTAASFAEEFMQVADADLAQPESDEVEEKHLEEPLKEHEAQPQPQPEPPAPAAPAAPSPAAKSVPKSLMQMERGFQQVGELMEKASLSDCLSDLQLEVHFARKRLKLHLGHRDFLLSQQTVDATHSFQLQRAQRALSIAFDKDSKRARAQVTHFTRCVEAALASFDVERRHVGNTEVFEALKREVTRSLRAISECRRQCIGERQAPQEAQRGRERGKKSRKWAAIYDDLLQVDCTTITVKTPHGIAWAKF